MKNLLVILILFTLTGCNDRYADLSTRSYVTEMEYDADGFHASHRKPTVLCTLRTVPRTVRTDDEKYLVGSSYAGESWETFYHKNEIKMYFPVNFVNMGDILVITNGVYTVVGNINE